MLLWLRFGLFSWLRLLCLVLFRLFVDLLGKLSVQFVDLLLLLSELLAHGLVHRSTEVGIFLLKANRAED